MLISLIGTENGSEIFTQPKKEDSSAILKVPAVWKRVVQNTLVIGAEVVNSSNRLVQYYFVKCLQVVYFSSFLNLEKRKLKTK